MVSFSFSTEPVAFLWQMIATINLTVMPQLLLRKFCLRESGYTAETCFNEKYIFYEIHQKASHWWFTLQLIIAVPSIFMIPILVPITNKIGRRNSMLIITLLDIITLSIYAINGYFKHEHPAWMIPGFIIQALYGGAKGIKYLCFTFVADITKHKLAERTLRMVMVEISLEIARVLGGLFTGYLLKALDYMSVFLFSIGIHGLVLFYVSWYLPKFDDKIGTTETKEEGETTKLVDKEKGEEEGEEEESKEVDIYGHNDDEDSSDDQTCCITEHLLRNSESENVPLIGELDTSVDDNEKEMSLFGVYKQQFKDIYQMMYNQPVIVHILLVTFFINLGRRGEDLVQTLYLKNKPFYFYQLYIGYYIGIQAGSRLLGSLLFVIFSSCCFNLNDYALMVTGSMSQVLSFAFIGMARSVEFLFCATAASFGIPLIFAASNSFLTKIVPDNQQSTIMGLMYSISAFSALCTTLLSSTLYRATLTYNAGTVYYGLAAFSGIGLAIILVSCIATKCYRRE